MSTLPTRSRTPVADLPVSVLREALLMGTDAAVARRFGVNPCTIYRWRLRLLPHTRPRLKGNVAPRRQQVLALLAQHPEGLRLCDLVRLLPDAPARQNILQVLAGARRWQRVTRNGAYWLVAQQAMPLEPEMGNG